MIDTDAIALVGLAGRFPEARDVGEYWENLLKGRECMTDLSVEDVGARGERLDRLRHPSYVLRRPLLPDMEYFDAEFFGMTPREAELRDPQHRVFLEVCHSALEHAGYDSARYPGAVGVYAGLNTNRYADLYLRTRTGLVDAVGELAVSTSNHADYLTTFTSYKLGLRGPSMTVSTACSGSLVAIHQACQALRVGECDMALAGGVEVEWPYGFGYVHSPGGIYPSDGYCRPFDIAAEGTVFGSGAGAVLLKRHADAVADGDTVYGLILGSAVNNDGAEKVGFSAPSVSGQAACVAEALVAADVDPRSISYVEAHGTATKLGDPIEVAALTRAFHAVAGDDNLDTGYCGIGSVKSNVGHLGPASGVAGLIKTVLALHHQTIPPTINFTEPNPALELDSTPFEVVAEARRWPRVAGSPRRAGVSSFGIGGTNAHVLLEEAPAGPARGTGFGGPELITVSARSTSALEQLRDRLARHLAWEDQDTEDVANTVRRGRRVLPVRDAVVAGTREEAVNALSGPLSDRPTPVGEVVLAFPGQGSQRPEMGMGLYTHLDGFRDRFDGCLADFSDLLGRDLLALWKRARDGAELAETVVAQPLLFSVEYALADVLRETGLPVSAVLGHSLGEVVAATYAGVFSRDAAIRVVAERARLMQEMPVGAMAAVAAGEDDIVTSLAAGVSVAAVNAARQVVLSGTESGLAETLDRLRQRGIGSRRLSTSHAYHSELMRDAVEPFRAAVAAVGRTAPSVEFVSCATGRVERELTGDSAFWAGQLVTPVRFADAVTELLANREQVAVLEVGPGTTLTELLRGTSAVRHGHAVSRPVIAAGPDPRAEYAGFLEVLGDLWRAGVDLDLGLLDRPGARRVALPGYPYERERHFVDHPMDEPSVGAPAVGSDMDSPAAVAARDAAPALWEVLWSRSGRPVPGPDIGPDVLVTLPEDPAAAREVLSLVQRAGGRPVRVRPAGAASAADASVDFRDRDAVLAFVRDLAVGGRLPSNIVHAVSYGPETTDDALDADQKPVVKSLVWLVQALQHYRGTAGHGELRLTALTRHAVDVTGGEPVVPARAMLSGLVRTVELEDPGFRCRLLDVGDRDSTSAVVDALRDDRRQVAAVRGAELWLPAVRSLPEEPGGGSRLRPRGVYLITGGLGALGRASALALAESGFEPRIVLLGRSAGGGQEFAEELTACGAEVEVIEADVADETQLAAAVDRVHRRFGPINGVLHAAGIAGDGLVEFRTDQQLDAVLESKVDGGAALHRLLAEESSLDFVVHYGSRAALTGLVGNGDYAAANAYLAALAARTTGGDRQVVTVNWPGWGESGMAARGAEPTPDADTVEVTLDGSEWFVDEHRIAGEPVLPGTGYLDLIMTTAMRRGLVPDDRPLRVTDLVFVAPLSVGGPTTVGITFRRRRDHFAVTVLSRTDEAAEWSEHARATLAVATDEPVHVDLGDLHDRAACGERLPTGGDGTVVAYGPRWRNVRSAVRVGDAVFGEIALPGEYRADLDDHWAHPAVLDMATSIVHTAATTPLLPSYYQEAVFFRAVPAEVFVVARETSKSDQTLVCDITLYTSRGREVARVNGFTMRAVEPDRFARLMLAASATPRSEKGSLLSPRDGVAMLRRIIDGPTPASVIVLRPWETLRGHLTVDRHALVPLEERAAPERMPATARPAGPAHTGSVAASALVRESTDSSVEQRLRVLWEQLIGVSAIGVDEDFFEIGGNSLAAVQLVSNVRETFGVQVSVGVVFETATIGRLAAEIERLSRGTS